MDRVKRISENIIETHKKHFTSDFNHNKIVLASVTNINSKQLRNQIAGFITKVIKLNENENKEKASNHSEIEEP